MMFWGAHARTPRTGSVPSPYISGSRGGQPCALTRTRVDDVLAALARAGDVEGSTRVLRGRHGME